VGLSYRLMAVVAKKGILQCLESTTCHLVPSLVTVLTELTRLLFFVRIAESRGIMRMSSCLSQNWSKLSNILCI
jgi:hypothetical protein